MDPQQQQQAQYHVLCDGLALPFLGVTFPGAVRGLRDPREGPLGAVTGVLGMGLAVLLSLAPLIALLLLALRWSLELKAASRGVAPGTTASGSSRALLLNRVRLRVRRLSMVPLAGAALAAAALAWALGPLWASPRPIGSCVGGWGSPSALAASAAAAAGVMVFDIVPRRRWWPASAAAAGGGAARAAGGGGGGGGLFFDGDSSSGPAWLRGSPALARLVVRVRTSPVMVGALSLLLAYAIGAARVAVTDHVWFQVVDSWMLGAAVAGATVLLLGPCGLGLRLSRAADWRFFHIIDDLAPPGLAPLVS